jgi:signal transduction histidine kinase
MTQLLWIEIFVLGASLIAAIYHLMLFIQQKDKFLLFYSLYLFAASAYIFFKLFSNNYNPFLPTANNWYYAIEEILQVLMYSSYATFAAVTLEVTKKPVLIKWCWIGLLIFSSVTIVVHISKAIFIGPGITTKFAYGFSRLTTIAVAGYALLMAWKVRTTIFQKTIIIGSYVYAFFAMFSVFSFIFQQSYFRLSGVEPYLIGSFIDIIIFSGALGYRFKKIADEKNLLLQLSLETSESRASIAKSLNDDVGAALSSMHVYAAVAHKLVDKDPEKTKAYLQEINFNTLQLMNEVSDIVWALNLAPDTIASALDTRIKRYGLEILAPQNITYTYLLEDKALQSIQDINTAKKVLLQVREGMQTVSKKVLSTSVLIKIVWKNNALQVSVQ